MNNLRLPFALVFALSFPLLAQEPVQEIASTATASAAPQYTPEQLDELLGPIALYPDALVALILPASTVPADIVLAARYLKDSDGQLSQVESRAWDDSVKALTHYPDVLKWMDENLTWTKQVGEAFAAQPADVMNAVQRLREKARAAGTLVDTPQQQVVVDNSAISIVPAQPDVIYVPYYNPDIVYVSRPAYYYSDPFITFGPAYAAGFWLSYNVDWGHRQVWYVNRSDRERFWRDHRDFWRRPTFPSRPGYVGTPIHRPWTPRQDSWRQTRITTTTRVQPQIVRPVPFANSPRTYAGAYSYAADSRRNYSGSRANEIPASPRPVNSLGRNVTSGARQATPAFAPTPQLQLANPLPQPMPSPLPELRSPAPQPTVNRSPGHDRRGENPNPRYFRESPAPQPQSPPVIVERNTVPANSVPATQFSHPSRQQQTWRPAPVAPAPQAAPAAAPQTQQATPAPAQNPSSSQPATNNGDRTQGHRRFQY